MTGASQETSRNDLFPSRMSAVQQVTSLMSPAYDPSVVEKTNLRSDTYLTQKTSYFTVPCVTQKKFSPTSAVYLRTGFHRFWF